MARFDDDEDWVGEPPEGRHDRSRADPGFWTQVPIAAVTGGAIMMVGLVILVVVLVSN